MRPDRYPCLLAAAAVLALAAPARADVVINEILYHAPDDQDDLQFVELHNPGRAPADLAGWTLKGAGHTFPPGTKIDPGGFLVVCKNGKEFRRAYGLDAAGEFPGTLGRNGEAVELRDAAGKRVDGVKYKSRAPWPAVADGDGASLERICPAAPGDAPENWAPSPLPTGRQAAGGTPGKKNAAYSATAPPVVGGVTAPTHAGPGQEVRVTAEVRAAAGLMAVDLLYRVAGSGSEGAEVAVPMAPLPGGAYGAVIPPQKAGQIVRYRVRAVDAAGAERLDPHPNDLRPAGSVYVHDPFRPGKIPLGYVVSVGRAEFRAAQSDPGPAVNRMWGQRPDAPDPPARGNSAFVFVDPKTGEPTLYDFVSIPTRAGGRKVRFHRDRPLDGMSTVNLIYEYHDRFPLTEHLAFEVYRKAGLPAPRTDYVRVWVDGRPHGFQLLVEQPNKSFLRRNGYDAGGELYKAVWFGGTLAERHEKKTHRRGTHAGLAELVRGLLAARGDDQWAYIKKHFDAAEVAGHYAVRTVLSDWDGFFNNYFLYHDTGGTGTWSLFPWDQDKTWGFHDGIGDDGSFVDMPITFGMEGDRPRGGGWWRPGGDLSRPLLANPTFRRHFLARVKDLLETVYTPEAFEPVIKEMGDRLEGEVRFRAEARRENPDEAVARFRRHLDSFRRHLTERRAFLLRQNEVRAAGKWDPAELK